MQNGASENPDEDHLSENTDAETATEVGETSTVRTGSTETEHSTSHFFADPLEGLGLDIEKEKIAGRARETSTPDYQNKDLDSSHTSALFNSWGDRAGTESVTRNIQETREYLRLFKDIIALRTGESAQIKSIQPRPAEWPACAVHDTGGVPYDLAVLIAITVLEGASLTSIRRAVSDLESQLSDLAGKPKEDPNAGRVSIPKYLTSLLDTFRAKTIETAAGSDKELRIVFIDQEEGEQLLRFLWSDLGGELGSVIRKWFVGLGSQFSKEIRAIAGRSAGRLFLHDARSVSVEIIEPWVKAKTTLPLLCVDVAFSFAAGDEASDHRPKCEAIIKEWAERGGFDQILAAGLLSRGVFSQEDPDFAGRITCMLASRHRWNALTQTLNTIVSVLQSAHEVQEGPIRAVSMLRGLQRADDWRVSYWCYWGIIGLLSKMSEDNQSAKSLEAILSDSRTGQAFSELLTSAFDLGDVELELRGVDTAIQDLLIDALRRWACDPGRQGTDWLLVSRLVEAANNSSNRSRIHDWLNKRAARLADNFPAASEKLSTLIGGQ